MAISTPAGTGFYVNKTFLAAKSITALSNANPALATSAAHGFADNDEILYKGGWELGNDSVFRVDQQDVNTFLVKGLNSLNTNLFANGGGVGTAEKVDSAQWIEVPKVISLNPSGGTPRFTDVRFIKALQGIKLPDGFEAFSMGFEIAFDPSQTNWDTLLDISRTFTPVAYKSVKGNGAATYGYGYFAMNEAPSQQAGQVDRVSATFAALGRVISYA